MHKLVASGTVAKIVYARSDLVLTVLERAGGLTTGPSVVWAINQPRWEQNYCNSTRRSRLGQQLTIDGVHFFSIFFNYEEIVNPSLQIEPNKPMVARPLPKLRYPKATQRFGKTWKTELKQETEVKQRDIGD